MQTLAAALRVFMNALSIWMMFMLLFQLFVSFFGYSRKTKDYPDRDPKLRFLVLIPAHNEEKVIAALIDNLRKMEYPRELYDFCVIADACTDRTADVARQMGADVIALTRGAPDEPTGKPVALKKALRQIPDYGTRYDFLLLLDADNLVDPNMLLELNSQLLAHPEADFVQTYAACKNKKGFVALFYYMNFTIANRFFHLGKSRLGLNAVLSGTGYAVRASYIASRGGWTALSLTEDFELQMEATAEGRRILWNHNVRVYDEKPTSVRVSYRQRLRWAQGHWFVAFHNCGKLVRALVHRRISPLEFISSFTYLFNLTPYICVLLQGVCTAALYLMQWTGAIPPDVKAQSISAMLWMNLPGTVLFLYMFVFLFYVGDWMDNGVRFSLRGVVRMYASVLFNTVLAGVAQFVGFFRRGQQSKWVKTDHAIPKLEADTPRLRGEKARVEGGKLSA